MLYEFLIAKRYKPATNAMIRESDIFLSKILIVDDEAVSAELLRSLLEAVGYTRAEVSTNPKEVVARHVEHRYDLILLDLQMPEMDGFQVIEDLKVFETDPYLPVIVLTAQHDQKLLALRAGAKDFITKPFDLAEVTLRMHNMLEVRLLYRKLADYNKALEAAVEERTAELRESEAHYHSLIDLASDWYWEQDENGTFVKISGPVLEILGVQFDPSESPGAERAINGWNEIERRSFQARIAARQPFLDHLFSRSNSDGSQQKFRISGEPIFDRACRFKGYRGIGVRLVGEDDGR